MIAQVSDRLIGEDIAIVSDMDLVASVMGPGTRNGDAVGAAADLFKRFGSLRGIARAGLSEIAQEQGIGLTRAARILSAIELGRRLLGDPVTGDICDSPARAWRLFLALAGLHETEAFMVLVMDTRNRVLKRRMISSGTVNESIVHPREVFRDAVREGGTRVIIGHNHPSGDTRPSRDDIRTTERVHRAGTVIGIELIDHLIITDTSYRSLREDGYFTSLDAEN